MENEKRLIYADSGQESVEYLKRHLIVGDSEFLRGYLQGAEALADGLAKLPPVDAVEVVHGRWVHHYHDSGEPLDDKWYCSECHMCNDHRRTWYCPNCGAKMDGDLDV